MNSVEAGRIPREFGDNPYLDVEIMDKKKHEYQPPKRDITKLEGHGQSLGGSSEIKADVAVPQQVTSRMAFSQLQGKR